MLHLHVLAFGIDFLVLVAPSTQFFFIILIDSEEHSTRRLLTWAKLRRILEVAQEKWANLGQIFEVEQILPFWQLCAARGFSMSFSSSASKVPRFLEVAHGATLHYFENSAEIWSSSASGAQFCRLIDSAIFCHFGRRLRRLPFWRVARESSPERVEMRGLVGIDGPPSCG